MWVWGVWVGLAAVLEIQVDGLLYFPEDAFADKHALVVCDIGLRLWNVEAGEQQPIHEDGLIDLQLGEALLDLLLVHYLVI